MRSRELRPSAAATAWAVRRFETKIVLVLGGNSGNELAAAPRFSEEGAQVVITGRDQTTLGPSKIPDA